MTESRVDPAEARLEKSPKAVVRQSGITSVVALVGVLSGLVLDLAWGSVFGIGYESDAFTLALRLPLAITAIAMVVANQVLVPTFGAWLTTMGERERARAMSAVMLACLGLSIVLALIFSFFAYPLMAAMAPGFADEPGKLDLAASMTRILAWYVPCVIVAEVLRCWLNAKLVIGFPAAMTLVLNVVSVAVILLGPRSNWVVPAAYVAGSLVQVLAMAIASFVKGWRPAAPAFGHPEVRRTLRLFSRPTVGAAMNPIVRIVEVFIASALPQGSTTLLHYGNRLASAVGGTIIFRSIMVTVLPRISRAFTRGDTPAFRSMTRLGLRLMLFLAVPMTILGVTLAPGLTQAVFGLVPKFKHEQIVTLGTLMALYSLSFAGSGLQRALLAPFYAMRDTRTPLRNTVYGIVANVGLLFILDVAMGDGARAIYLFPIAYSASQYVNVGHAWWLMRAVPGLERLPLLVPIAGSLVCGLSGGASAIAVTQVLPASPTGLASGVGAFVGLVVSGLVGFLAFRRGSTAGRRVVGPAQESHQAPNMQTPAVAGQEDNHVDTVDLSKAAPPAPVAPEPSPRRRFDLATLGTALLGIALTVYTTVAIADGSSHLVAALPLAAIVGITLLIVALYDLETFVLIALLTRASMDAIGVNAPHTALGLMLLGFGTVWLLLRKARLGSRYPSSGLGIAYLVFVIVAFMGVITSANMKASLTEWSRIATIVVVFLVVEQFAARGSKLGPFTAAIGLGIVVPATVAFSQLTSGQGLFIAGGFSRITGTFDHSNPLAYFSVVVLLLMTALVPYTRGATRAGVLCVGLLAVIVLGLTYTRSAWLVAAFGVVILLWRRRAGAALAVCAALAILVAGTPMVQNRFADLATSAQLSGKPANSLAWRWAYWGESLDVAKPSPIAGVGLRSVAQTTAEGKQPHNDVIRAYVELGIPGLLSYVLVLVLMLWTSWRAAADAARRRLTGIPRAITEAGFVVAVAVAILSVVANLMSQVVVMMYAVSVIALSSGAYLRRRRLDAEADSSADRAARSMRIVRT